MSWEKHEGWDHHSFANDLMDNIRHLQQDMERDMAESRREMESMFTGFSANRMHEHYRHHPHHSQSSAWELEQQKRRAEEEAQRLRQQAELEQAEAVAAEERRRLQRIEEDKRQRAEAERREKERVRLAAQREEQRLLWEKQEAEREVRERLEAIARKEREARLAEERRIAAQRAAEQALIEEEQRKAAEQEAETSRVTVFEIHHQLIGKAVNSTLLQLDQQLKTLVPLTQPSKRFVSSAAQGIPLADDGKGTLFLSILQNQSLDSKAKFQFIELLLDQKGYAPYFHYLLSSPIIELLIAEAQPKANEQGQLIAPANAVVQELFRRAVAKGFDINTQVGELIYPTLVTLGMGEEVFAYHLQKKSVDVMMSFLTLWESRTIPSMAIYGMVFAKHPHMSEEVYQAIKTHFMELYSNNYAAFINAVASNEKNKERVGALFLEWGNAVVERYRAASSDPSSAIFAYAQGELTSFVSMYTQALSHPEEEKRFGLDAPLLKRLIHLQEACAPFIYGQLKQNKSIKPETLMMFLSLWLSAFDLPHNFSQVRELYQVLVQDSKKMIEHEQAVVAGLVRSNKAWGLELFQFLSSIQVSKTKLLDHAKAWFSVLNEEELEPAYKSIRGAIQYSTLGRLRFSFRSVGEMQPCQRLADGGIINNTDAILKWLNYTRPGVLGISCSNKHSSSAAFKALCANREAGKARFELERERAEEEINEQLRAEGEEGTFRL